MPQTRLSLLGMVKLPLMRFLFVIFIAIAIILGVLTYQNRFGGEDTIKTTRLISENKKENNSPGNYEEQKILFVPYWTLNSNENIEDFETLAYFGISVNRRGINREEAGFKNLGNFRKISVNKKNYLVVRMLDSEIVSDILQNQSSRKKIIDESINVSKENNFLGIILDLEFSAIPFESVVKRVTGFYNEFYTSSHKNDLEFSALIYGDTYFRGRPYEVSEIGKSSDRIYIMAYDFHKARGNPGPNFPFDSKNKYDYDFKTMINDFLSDVSSEKLVTLFGMFGYDWVIDNEGRGKEFATARTTYQAETFLEKCTSDNSCSIFKENATQIKYEKDGKNHEVWFENSGSIKEKIKYLNSQGLKSVGYWANSFWNSKL